MGTIIAVVAIIVGISAFNDALKGREQKQGLVQELRQDLRDILGLIAIVVMISVFLHIFSQAQ